MTPYHSRYWATLLTLREPPGSIEGLSRSISNARVDLNPHQVEAALFALRSPFSKGVILADEVGLGKTIEAGIVLSQKWAERRRRLLLIVPATLRKQWQQEMQEKFYLPTSILDARTFTQAQKSGSLNPFDQSDRLIVCSYQFAAAKANEMRSVPWDLVVVDEAHRLRNVFKPSNKIARALSESLREVPKLLLTATPLQNSLMELYGLASVIDDHIFGDAGTFRDLFVRAADESDRNRLLRERLSPLCVRTLRKQVVEYVPFTRRVPITQDFIPSDEEQRLYEEVSQFLQREFLLSLPNSQRTLITLVLRKLLASSTFAIAGTLHRLITRLEYLGKDAELIDDDDLEGIEELEDELREAGAIDDTAALSINAKQLAQELAALRRSATLADSIATNAKGDALIPALGTAFDRAGELGAQRKAVVFTESRRTQQYLFDLLSRNRYEGQLVLMNGANTDPHSKTIYEGWLRRHKDDDSVSGSKAVDMKAAIAEEFRDRASILIATEAAAEGVNLQFCSLVVNFDLPWNPQRIEQRIGRCHRYGQKHDVVVVNFLNRRNQADQRVFELLSEKFRLFDGVFGSSDEVLGALDSGVDIERRIAQVYQSCRTPEEITAAFDRLQAELDEQIRARMSSTRQILLDHFDEEVNARLRVHRDQTVSSLTIRERWLMDLTRYECDGHVRFDLSIPRFEYTGPDGPKGNYHFDWKQAEANGDHFYRQDHPLAQTIIGRATGRVLPPAALEFDYTAHNAMVAILKPLLGKSGWLELARLTVEALATEEYLIITARADDGAWLDEETADKLFRLSARTLPESPRASPDLSERRTSQINNRLRQVEERNARFFDEEVLKLDHWSDDLKQGLERELKELDRQIREARRTAALMGMLQDKLEAQKAVKALESERSQKRRSLFEAQDDIDKRRDSLIADIESRLQRRTSEERLFMIRWSVV